MVKIGVTNLNYGWDGHKRVSKTYPLSAPWMVHQPDGGNLSAATWDEAMTWVELIHQQGWGYALMCYSMMLSDMRRNKVAARTYHGHSRAGTPGNQREGRMNGIQPSEVCCGVP